MLVADRPEHLRGLDSIACASGLTLGMARAKSAPSDSSANLGFETKLRLSADKLRNNRDAAFSPSEETARAVIRILIFANSPFLTQSNSAGLESRPASTVLFSPQNSGSKRPALLASAPAPVVTAALTPTKTLPSSSAPGSARNSSHTSSRNSSASRTTKTTDSSSIGTSGAPSPRSITASTPMP